MKVAVRIEKRDGPEPYLAWVVDNNLAHIKAVGNDKSAALENLKTVLKLHQDGLQIPQTLLYAGEPTFIQGLADTFLDNIVYASMAAFIGGLMDA